MMLGPLVFRRAQGGRVKLSAEARFVVEQFRQHHEAAKEAGGVLLGRHIRGTQNVVIDEVTTPMRWDGRSRYSFRRRACLHQRVIDERWRESGGTCQYLGEWHTHPETTPTPSGTDLADWKRRLRDDDVESNMLLFMIVGLRVDRLWEGNRATQSRLIMLSQENE
jgi:integrative and conjugative element protein (TIGR02256 family)